MNKKGDVLFGKITKVGWNGLFISTTKGFTFFIPKTNVTDKSKTVLESIFKKGDFINFIVDEIDNETKSGVGNFKANHPLFAKAPFNEELKETKYGFKTLKSKIDKELME
ncbi:S1 RNA-binding domain-containing protein [Mycoplasmopsis opalescens]|uniref:S1 RNA-binding domain-containing protein n=1 Tax=Mycoplasmopsis opalescens TaxID=114886 RepID=UPI0004A7131D|nr:S1 RNA-binding domain-containing protein [Mycoplasmopsis opalescens]